MFPVSITQGGAEKADLVVDPAALARIYPGVNETGRARDVRLILAMWLDAHRRGSCSVSYDAKAIKALATDWHRGQSGLNGHVSFDATTAQVSSHMHQLCKVRSRDALLSLYQTVYVAVTLECTQYSTSTTD